MTKESVRKCSHCGHNGHNSRTCNNGKGCSFKLFGVRIDTNSIGKDDDQFVRKSLSNGVESSIRKSKSMGNLQAACNNIIEHNNVAEHGYLSEGQLQSKSAYDRKKGTPWTENEHRSFLVGLKKLGKGDWRGISRNYVPTRTPTQVASHAQKYYIRMSASEKKKRRSSVFDMPLKEGTPSPQASPSNRDPEISLQLCTSPPTPMKNNTSNIQGQASTSRTPPSAMFDRPPLSPVARPFGMPDFCCPPYMVDYPCYGLGIHTNKHMSTVFVPGVNYANHYYVYQTNGVEPLVTCAPSRSQASSGLLPLPLPHGPSQAALASTAAKKDGLTAGIGALSL